MDAQESAAQVPAAPITAAVMDALFGGKNGICSSRSFYNRPDVTAIEKLSAAAESYRHLAMMATTQRSDSDCAERFENGLSILHGALPEIITRWAEMATSAPAGASHAELGRLVLLWKVVDEAHAWAEIGDNKAQPPPPRAALAPPARWHVFVVALADDFRDAMRSANQGDIGLTNDGPLAKFLCRVIPLVSGEKVQPTTAIRYITRRSQGG